MNLPKFPSYCYGVGCALRKGCGKYRSVDDMPTGEIVAGSCIGNIRQSSGRPLQFDPIVKPAEEQE